MSLRHLSLGTYQCWGQWQLIPWKHQIPFSPNTFYTRNPISSYPTTSYPTLFFWRTLVDKKRETLSQHLWHQQLLFPEGNILWILEEKWGGKCSWGKHFFAGGNRLFGGTYSLRGNYSLEGSTDEVETSVKQGQTDRGGQNSLKNPFPIQSNKHFDIWVPIGSACLHGTSRSRDLAAIAANLPQHLSLVMINLQESTRSWILSLKN